MGINFLTKKSRRWFLFSKKWCHFEGMTCPAVPHKYWQGNNTLGKKMLCRVYNQLLPKGFSHWLQFTIHHWSIKKKIVLLCRVKARQTVTTVAKHENETRGCATRDLWRENFNQWLVMTKLQKPLGCNWLLNLYTAPSPECYSPDVGSDTPMIDLMHSLPANFLSPFSSVEKRSLLVFSQHKVQLLSVCYETHTPKTDRSTTLAAPGLFS